MRGEKIKYGALRTADEEGKEEPRRKRREWLEELKKNGGGGTIRVETYSAYARKTGTISHGLAQTVQKDLQLGSLESLGKFFEESERRLEETSKNWKQKIFSYVRTGDDAISLRKHVNSATNWSVIVNVGLTLVKLWSAYVSGSLAVLASLVDSFLDLAQTGVLFVVEKKSELPPDEEFPAGRKRLEPVGVIVCAMLMAIGSVGVMCEAVETLMDAFFHHDIPIVDVSLPTLAVLVATVLSKALLWVYCAAVEEDSSTALALAEDHANDVASNTVAILACGLATWRSSLWWADPVGAILISLYICNAWFYIAKDHVEQIVGKGATTEQLNQLAALANTYEPSLASLVKITAYHFGPSFLVEVHMAVHDDDIHVSKIHQISTDLASTIETLSWVEKCFVSF